MAQQILAELVVPRLSESLLILWSQLAVVSPTQCIRAEPSVRYVVSIEEGLKQKTRQNVVVFYWGSRSNAALGNLV